MLLSFLLALTLAGEQPLAELRTGSPLHSIRAVTGVVPAPNGGWLVAWSSGSAITVTPAGADGQPGATRKLIPGRDAALSATARGPIILWTASTGTFAAPLAADGSFSGPASKLSPFAPSTLSLACNATRCLAALGSSTTILDDEARILSTTAGTDSIAAMAADPSGFLVVRSTNTALRAERLDQTGAVTATVPFPDSAAGFGIPAAAAFDGQRYAILYPSNTTPDMLGVTLTLGGTLSTPRAVYHPLIGALDGISLAWNGSEYLLAASDITELGVGFEGTIWPSILNVQRLDRDLAPAASVITLSDAPRSSYGPHVAGAGGKFFVAWQHSGVGASVRGAQLAGSNAVQSVFSLGPLPQLTPVLAAAEDRDLAMWLEADDATNTETLFYRRLPGDAEPRLLAQAYDISQPAAASIGSDWLALWTEAAAADPQHRELKGAIISPFSNDVQRISLGLPGGLVGMAAGANGWVLLVNNAGKLQTVRVTRAGQVMPAADLSILNGGDAVIASSGSNFLVAAAGGSSGVRLALLDANGQVSATGQLDAPNSFFVAAISARRDFLIATAGNGISVWRVGATLTNAQLTAHIAATEQPLELIPFGSGSLLTWGANALRLDAGGAAVGTPEGLGSPILAIAPHGASATAIFGRNIDALPLPAQQLFVRELSEMDARRRRSLR